MLINTPQVKIIEKIFRDSRGELAVGYFAILEWEGKFYVKLIRSHKINNSCKCLSDLKYSNILADTKKNLKKFKTPLNKAYSHIESPFNNLLFFVSQQTRAPAK